MSKHKKAKRARDRGLKSEATTAKTGASTGKAPQATPVVVSFASGVRLLRERLQTAPRRPRAKLLEALSLLEAEYDRVRSFAPHVGGHTGTRSEPGEEATEERKGPRPAVSFVPTPPEMVDAMLELAGVGPNDVVYDLGSGDGRIVIAAAQKYGARGVGLDIDPIRIKEAQERATRENVSDRVTFREVDLFDADLRAATVVMLYLLPALNLELRQRLVEQLAPGTRIVSHAFDMGDWAPAQVADVAGRRVYLWIVPKTAEGEAD